MPECTQRREQERYERLVEHLKRHRAFVVWDNFESVHEGMPEEERQRLRTFLQQLRGGKTCVLLTSRTDEKWLGTDCARTKGDLPGLEGEALWAFCEAVAGERGFTLDREDEDLRNLLVRLEGNPLSMRAVLSRLGECSPAELHRQLEDAFAGHPEEEGTGRLLAAFQVVRNGAGPELKPVLELLGLHEHFAAMSYLLAMLVSLSQIKPDSPEQLAIKQNIQRCFALLEGAGLCTPLGQNLFRIHPALRSCLAQAYPAPEEVQRVFVVGMSAIESHYHNDEAQRRWFCGYHEANLSHARSLAERWTMEEELLLLLVQLAISANDRGDYRRAEALWLELAQEAERQGNVKERRRAYSSLYTLASNRGDEDAAKGWAQLAAALWEQDRLSADAWFDRGNAAFQSGDITEAKGCWEKALELRETEGDARAIHLYGLLGTLAVMLGDLAEAERRLRQSLSAAEKQGNLEVQANAHRSLADLEEDKGNPSDAQDHYLVAIALYQQLHDRYREAITRWALGGLYIQTGHPSAAKKQLHAALALLYQLDRNQVEVDIARCIEGLGVACALEGRTGEAKLSREQALEIYNRRGQAKDAARVRRSLDRLNNGPKEAPAPKKEPAAQKEPATKKEPAPKKGLLRGLLDRLPLPHRKKR